MASLAEVLNDRVDGSVGVVDLPISNCILLARLVLRCSALLCSFRFDLEGSKFDLLIFPRARDKKQ